MKEATADNQIAMAEPVKGHYFTAPTLNRKHRWTAPSNYRFNSLLSSAGGGSWVGKDGRAERFLLVRLADIRGVATPPPLRPVLVKSELIR
jgi:hypothetical protein